MNYAEVSCPDCKHELLEHRVGYSGYHTHCGSLGYELSCGCDLCRGTGMPETEDTLTRDACSVVPVPKSEYRRRLLAWRDSYTRRQLEETKTGFTDKLLKKAAKQSGILLEEDVAEAIKEWLA